MERIMIIDSDLNQMKLLKDGLTGEYLTLGCSRGTKAIDLFNIFQPSALILDPGTFDLNTREFVAKVRKLPYRKNILILALSRMTTIRQIEESFDLGVDMIFSKPCALERIKKKLNQYFVTPAAVPSLEASSV